MGESFSIDIGYDQPFPPHPPGELLPDIADAAVQAVTRLGDAGMTDCTVSVRDGLVWVTTDVAGEGLAAAVLRDLSSLLLGLGLRTRDVRVTRHDWSGD